MKIQVIKAYTRAGALKYTWRADILFWDSLNHILPSIEKELPDCILEIDP